MVNMSPDKSASIDEKLMEKSGEMGHGNDDSENSSSQDDGYYLELEENDLLKPIK